MSEHLHQSENPNQPDQEDFQLKMATANMQEAERVTHELTHLLIDDLLVATGGNVVVVTDLLRDIVNLAGNAATLAVAIRRVNALGYAHEHNNLHPDNLTARQDSINFGQQGAYPILQTLETIAQRAETLKNTSDSPLTSHTT